MTHRMYRTAAGIAVAITLAVLGGCASVPEAATTGTAADRDATSRGVLAVGVEKSDSLDPARFGWAEIVLTPLNVRTPANEDTAEIVVGVHANKTVGYTADVVPGTYTVSEVRYRFADSGVVQSLEAPDATIEIVPGVITVAPVKATFNADDATHPIEWSAVSPAERLAIEDDVEDAVGNVFPKLTLR